VIFNWHFTNVPTNYADATGTAAVWLGSRLQTLWLSYHHRQQWKAKDG